MLPEPDFLARSIEVPLTCLLSSHGFLLNCNKRHPECFLEVGLMRFFSLKPKYEGRTLNRNYKQLSHTLFLLPSNMGSHSPQIPTVPRIMVLLFSQNQSFSFGDELSTLH